MTTHSDIEPYWFSKTAGEILAAVEARDETWAAVPGCSRYEWSDKGRVRSLDCTVNGRQLRGRVLKTRVSNSGYELVNVRDDEGRRVTVTVHAMVLLAHHPAFAGLDKFPEGLETRHGPAGPLCNAYPENLWPGTKKQNAGDKDEQEPQFECRNHATCGNMVHNQGRRCLPCTEAVGREAALLLGAGANLMWVAERYGYSSPDWTHKIAVRYGGYEGTKGAALMQRPGWRQRRRLARLTRGDAP